MTAADGHSVNRILNTPVQVPVVASVVDKHGFKALHRALVEGSHPAAKQRVALARAAQAIRDPDSVRKLVASEADLEGYYQEYSSPDTIRVWGKEQSVIGHGCRS